MSITAMALMRGLRGKAGHPRYRKDILLDLNSRNYRGACNRFKYEHRFGWVVKQLHEAGLSQEKYYNFMLFLAKLSEILLHRPYQPKMGERFELILPPTEQLDKIDFTRLLGHRKAIKMVRSECFRPKGNTFVVDLTVLPDIYRMHFQITK